MLIEYERVNYQEKIFGDVIKEKKQYMSFGFLLSKKLLINVFVFIMIGITTLSTNALELKPITLVEPHFSGAGVYTNIYSNSDNSMVVARLFYGTTATQVVSTLYDLTSATVMLHESHPRGSSVKFTYEKALAKHGLTKETYFKENYISGRGSYFDLGEMYVFVRGSNRCSTPFDSYFKVTDPLYRLIHPAIVILVKGDYVHNSSDECDNMKGESSVNIKSKSVFIDRIWEINKSLYIVSLFDETSLLYFDNKFELISPQKNIRLVNYKKLSEFISDLKWNHDLGAKTKNTFMADSEAVSNTFIK